MDFTATIRHTIFPGDFTACRGVALLRCHLPLRAGRHRVCQQRCRASSAHPIRHLSNRATTQRARRALRTRGARLQFWFLPNSFPELSAQPRTRQLSNLRNPRLVFLRSICSSHSARISFAEATRSRRCCRRLQYGRRCFHHCTVLARCLCEREQLVELTTTRFQGRSWRNP